MSHPRSGVLSLSPRAVCVSALVVAALGLSGARPVAHAQQEPATYQCLMADFDDGNPYSALFIRIHAEVPAGSTVRFDARSPKLHALLNVEDVRDADGKLLPFDERLGWHQIRVDQVPVLSPGGIDLVLLFFGAGENECDLELTVYAHPARFGGAASDPVWVRDNVVVDTWSTYEARETLRMDEAGRAISGFVARPLPSVRGRLREALFVEPDPLMDPPRGSQANLFLLGSEIGRQFVDQPALRTIHAAPSPADAGHGVTIAVLDTGIDAAHPRFAGRLVPGFDFVDGDDDPSESGPMDESGDVGLDFGHGTFVAGLALAVAPAARILPVRVLDGDGRGTAAGIADGIKWAVDRGARVINLSLGTPTLDNVLVEAAEYADARGAILVAAAGNRGKDRRRLDWPSAGPNTLAVKALGGNGRRAAFSNGPGSARKRPLIAAPGTRLVGPYPGGRWAQGSGSSFAAALVSGAVARVLQSEASSDVWTARRRLATRNRLDLRKLGL